MISRESKSVSDRAKRLYADRLQATLEAEHKNRFIAIEPDSGEYFLADTFDRAIRMARTKFPDRLSYTIRIGHPAVFTIGVMQRRKRKSIRNYVG